MPERHIILEAARFRDGIGMVRNGDELRLRVYLLEMLGNVFSLDPLESLARIREERVVRRQFFMIC